MADEPNSGSFNPFSLIYISPDTAIVVIERHFSHMVSDNVNEFRSDLDDLSILYDVFDTYTEMLQENDGHISVRGIKRVCYSAFKHLKPIDNSISSMDALKLIADAVQSKCMDFVNDLVSTKDIPNDTCIYNVNKVDNLQSQIKYVHKADGKGFVRKGGTIAWRFLNPGCLRDSPYKCAILSTEPNGDFAVFDSQEKGRFAIRFLLENAEKYRNNTPRQAIPKYAPKKENNTQKYIRDLSRQGVDVDKKLTDLTESEWEKLLDAISTIEGWNNQGEIEEF